MIADIQGRRSHGIVADGLLALEHLDLRGCTHTEATRDFTAAVTDTGLAPGALAMALATVADVDATATTPQQQLACQQWGHLLAGRGLTVDSDANKLPDDIRIRYGADNDTVRC